MSSGQRMPRQAATININLVKGMINLGLERLEVCGSYRRNSSSIGDVDLVALPSDYEQFLDHLDDLVKRDLVKRGKTAAGKESWGEKKRLLEFHGLAFDIAIATPFNYGYQKWLRTGPGEANTILMSLLERNSSRVRMDDGYLWHVTYHTNYISAAERKAAKDAKKPAYHKLGRINIPDEETFFKVLGMPFIQPEQRSEYPRPRSPESPVSDR